MARNMGTYGETQDMEDETRFGGYSFNSPEQSKALFLEHIRERRKVWI